MKRSKFTDEQILAIVKEGEAGRKVADLDFVFYLTYRTGLIKHQHHALVAYFKVRFIDRLVIIPGHILYVRIQGRE